jgi:hypothetical protein
MTDCPASDRGASSPVQSSTGAWFWGCTELPVRRSVEYLSIWFNDDCTLLQASSHGSFDQRAQSLSYVAPTFCTSAPTCLRQVGGPVVVSAPACDLWHVSMGPPVPRRWGRAPTSSPAFHSGFKDLEALLCNCLYTICGLRGQGGSWQDRVCAALAVLRRDAAVLPMAAEMTWHTSML